QACDPKGTTVKADVYSLGAILYELLTGTTANPGKTPAAALAWLLQDGAFRGVCERNPGVPRDLEAICHKCLAHDPTERYASAKDLADDLERHRLGQAVSAQPPGFWDWLSQMLRTRPEPNFKYSWRVSVWGGGVLCLTHLAIFALVQSDAPALSVWAVQA